MKVLIISLSPLLYRIIINKVIITDLLENHFVLRHPIAKIVCKSLFHDKEEWTHAYTSPTPVMEENHTINSVQVDDLYIYLEDGVKYINTLFVFIKKVYIKCNTFNYVMTGAVKIMNLSKADKNT